MKTYYEDTVELQKFVISGKRCFTATKLKIRTIDNTEAWCVLTNGQCRKLAKMLMGRMPKKTRKAKP